jgi:hypothetical protein
MNRRVLTIVIGAAAGVAVLGGIGWWSFRSFFFDEYTAIRAETADLRSRTEAYEGGMKGSRAIKIGLRDAAATMLGGDQAVVEHRLRGMLSEVAERNGLGEVVVTHGRPRGVSSPADARGSGVSRGFRRMLGERADFAVVRGRVQGLGSLDSVVRALADLRAQAWVHRVEGFTITPKGREGTVFELKADFATIFSPELVETGSASPALVSAAESDVASLLALVSRAPFGFAEAAPEPQPAPVIVQRDPPRPPPPPYDKWRVTGVLESLETGGVVEVMLFRADTGETRTLAIGQRVLGATLTAAGGERAWFDKDGATVVVRAGETLAEGRPAETVHSDAISPG